jgi:hypothetical protein
MLPVRSPECSGVHGRLKCNCTTQPRVRHRIRGTSFEYRVPKTSAARGHYRGMNWRPAEQALLSGLDLVPCLPQHCVVALVFRLLSTQGFPASCPDSDHDEQVHLL